MQTALKVTNHKDLKLFKLSNSVCLNEGKNTTDITGAIDWIRNFFSINKS